MLDKKDLKDALNIALDHPTIENLIKFKRIQQKIQKKSSKFAEIFSLVSLLDPETEPNNMSNSRLTDIEQKFQEHRAQELLSEMPKYWGLVLQVSRDCPFSIGFGRIVKEFAEKYNFQLYALSDVEEEFWGINTILDNGIANELNPKRGVPALFLLKSDGLEMIPIARTLITEDEVIKNIVDIDKYMGGLI